MLIGVIKISKVKIIRKWKVGKDFTYGYDISGQLFIRHDPCEATMNLVDITQTNMSAVKNKYICPVCEKIKIEDRYFK